MWSSAIGAPQRKRVAIGKTVTMSKLLTSLVETMIIDAAGAGFINCELPKSLNDTYLLIRARHDNLWLLPNPLQIRKLSGLGDTLLGSKRGCRT